MITTHSVRLHSQLICIDWFLDSYVDICPYGEASFDLIQLDQEENLLVIQNSKWEIRPPQTSMFLPMSVLVML